MACQEIRTKGAANTVQDNTTSPGGAHVLPPTGMIGSAQLSVHIPQQLFRGQDPSSWDSLRRAKADTVTDFGRPGPG